MTLRARIPTLAVAILVLLAVAGSAAARARVVLVPHLRGDVTGAYATLHRDGLRVSIRHPFTLRTDAVTVVSASAPKAGRRVRRGSTVTLTVRCCQRLSHAMRTGAESLVPELIGLGLADATAWARGAGRRLVAHLSALRGAIQPTLAGNYVVAGQSHPDGWGLAGKASLLIGADQGRVVPCALPRSGVLVARNAQAVVYSVATPGYFGPTIYYGCLRASGARRGFTSTGIDGGYTSTILKSLTLTGTEAAGLILHGGGKYVMVPGTWSVRTWNLRTGRAATVVSEPEIDGKQTVRLDDLAANSAGFTAWREVRTPIYHGPAFTGVSCPTAVFCAAVDNAGNVFTTTNPTGGRSAWMQTQLPISSLNAISCASASLCVAAGNGQLFVTTAPASGVVGWSAIPLAEGFSGVSCPSASLCVAVGGSGIATSTDPAGGLSSWRLGQAGAGQLSGVSCPTASLCVASDGTAGNVLSTTDPAGGVSTWSAAAIDGTRGLTAIGCSPGGLCVTASSFNDLLSSSNPAGGVSAWQTSNENIGISTAFSCPTNSLCVSAWPGGVATSTNPTGGDGSWSVTHLNVSGSGVSCAEATLCVVVGISSIANSTNPTGGSSAWSSALVDTPACAVADGCATEQIVAHDGSGMRTLDSTGPGSGTQLQKLTLTDTQLSWTHDGTAQSATLG